MSLSPSRMAKKATTSSDAVPWYCHPVYARYWQHYHQAMTWMQNHRYAYKKAMESYFNSLWHFSSVVLPQNYYADQSGNPEPFYNQSPDPQDSLYPFQRSEESGQLSPEYHWNQASSRKRETSSSEEEIESESDDEILCDVSNMEITEELRQYFAETERHREEHRRQQQLDAERLREYVNADHDLYYNVHRTVKPPTERPGERRQAEMKKLYGDSAAKIMAMEAAIQLTFNKYCDRKRPKYWPVIPLKF